MLLQVLALASAAFLIATYVKVRLPQLTVVDIFMFCFLVQYGPHALFPNSLNVFAPEVGGRVEANFLIGMSLAYVALACGLLIASAVSLPAKTAPARAAHRPKKVVLPLVLASIYITLFALAQGDGLQMTREYLSGLVGRSSYSYTQIRREVFEESFYVRLASVTRFTTTALLFAWLLVLIRPIRITSVALGAAAACLFIICGMQMNKFPFIYFLVLSGLALSVGGFRLGRRKPVFILGGALVVALPVMYGLYLIQYREVATLDGERLLMLLAYRVFFCSADVLRLWFDYFPAQEGFLGLQGMGGLTMLLGLAPLSATEIIPEVYVSNTDTTFQTGFIGSGFATAGLTGVLLYGSVVGFFVGMLSNLQWADRNRQDLAPFWCVLAINMFFLTTRELHTAMLSGGTVSVLLILLAWRGLLKGSVEREPHKGDTELHADCQMAE